MNNADPNDIRDLYAAYNTTAVFAEQCLKLNNLDGDLVPMKPAPSQIKLWRRIDRAIARKGFARIVVLKARRVMVSMGTAAEFFRRTAFEPGKKALVLAHRDKAALNLFDYYYTFAKNYQPLSNGTASLALPSIVSDTAQRLEFANGASIAAFTGGNPDATRSFGAQLLHLSELAFMDSAQEMLRAATNVIPLRPGTIIVAESTANGQGNPFEQLYSSAGNGNAIWEQFFFAWWEHPENWMKLPCEPYVFQSKLTRNEQDLRQKYGLKLEQLYWRRCKIDELKGDVDGFNQEYPGCPEDAFLASGSPRFQLSLVNRHKADVGFSTGNLRSEMIGTRRQFYFDGEREGRGPLRVWEMPIEGREYVIGADPARGIDVSAQKGGNKDPDYTVAQVVDLKTGRQVATYRERTEPTPGARYISDLARWFNHAFIVPEANELGFLQSLLAEYPNELIYRREPGADYMASATLHQMGFLTTSKSKPQLVAALEGTLFDGSIQIVNPHTLEEMARYVRKPNGTTEAAEGNHDDEVIALALAVVGLKVAPEVMAMTKRYQAQVTQFINQPTLQVYGRRKTNKRDPD